MDGIQRGKVTVVNPFNRREREVDLRPQAVHSLVFWSKNFQPFLDLGAHQRLTDLGFALFFNFTVNLPNDLLEPKVPPLDARLAQVRELVLHFSPDRVNWRFDPICFYEHDGAAHHTLTGFEALARSMADLGITRCITSFYDPYRKVDLRLARLGKSMAVRFLEPGNDTRKTVIRKMATLLATLNIRLFLCCEKNLAADLSDHPNLAASACIDGAYLKELFGGSPSLAKDTGQRRDKGCGCTRSVDIGSYALHPCPHNCLFCYANPLMDPNNA